LRRRRMTTRQLLIVPKVKTLKRSWKKKRS
jgi:hypothetical protein